MDIMVSSNLERLLWWIGGEQEVNRCMADLKASGTYTITQDMRINLTHLLQALPPLKKPMRRFRHFIIKPRSSLILIPPLQRK
jgi:hypothetical protein